MKKQVFSILILFFFSTLLVQTATAGEEDWDEMLQKEKKNPVDVGGYASVASYIGIMDTGRLTAKIDGGRPFRTYTPDMDFELHLFGRGAAITGLSGGIWGMETTTNPAAGAGDLDTTISGWDIQMDFGAPVAEYKLGALSILVGLGYAENRIKFDGDFNRLRISDEDLPDGESEATLKQQAFVYDAAVRTEFREPIFPGTNGAGLMVYGLSLGYKGQLATKWEYDGKVISDVPYVAENMLFARFHFGFGGGAYLSGEDY